ncbi:MAG TPA: HD-GYP domain-containing protein [Selenomonadales bacterium]|nr:HD-GYP domain-containing protein [Selenomonadales bacterium]
MKGVPVQELVPGMVVAREVSTGSGVILLEPGARLTAAQIANLQVWDVSHIYIETQQPSAAGPVNLTRAEFIEEYTKTIEAIKTIFEGIREHRQIPIAGLQAMVDETLVVLVNTVGVLYYLYEVREHSNYTFQHSINVAVVSGVLGNWLNYEAGSKNRLILAGLLHDIGKLFIPLPILDKPGKLSHAEFEAVKKHPEEGHHLVKYADELPRDVKMGILQHHERLDGSGYPFGFTGNEIHEYARIVAVADIYDAMVSDRTYRKRLTPLLAAEKITDQMYRQLDTHVCLTFLNNIKNYFTGMSVLLSNGKQAKIIMLDQFWTKPLVQTDKGELLDLRRGDVKIVDVLAT